MRSNIVIVIVLLILITSCSEGDGTSNVVHSEIDSNEVCTADYSLSESTINDISLEAVPVLASSTSNVQWFSSDELSSLRSEISEAISSNECLISIYFTSLDDQNSLNLNVYPDWKLHPMSTYKPILSAFYYMTVGTIEPINLEGDHDWEYYEEQNRNMIVDSDNFAATRIFKFLGEKYYGDLVLMKFNEFMRVNGMKNSEINLWNFYIDDKGLPSDEGYEPPRIESGGNCDFCIDCNQISTAKDMGVFLTRLYDDLLVLTESDIPTLLSKEVKTKIMGFMNREGQTDEYGFVGTFDELLEPQYFSKYGYFVASENHNFLDEQQLQY